MSLAIQLTDTKNLIRAYSSMIECFPEDQEYNSWGYSKEDLKTALGLHRNRIKEISSELNKKLF